MRIFLDSNVLLSAALWPTGVTAACYRAAVSSGHTVIVSDYVFDEVRTVAERKFPDRAGVIDDFLHFVSTFAVQVTTPKDSGPDEGLVRDHKDRPVLRGARSAKCDVLVTGDRDLLEAEIGDPEIVTPADYLRRYGQVDPAVGPQDTA